VSPAESAAKTPLPLLIGGNGFVQVLAAEIGPVYAADEADLGVDLSFRSFFAGSIF